MGMWSGSVDGGCMRLLGRHLFMACGVLTTVGFEARLQLLSAVVFKIHFISDPGRTVSEGVCILLC